MTNEMPEPTQWDYAVLVPTVYGTIGFCFAERGEAVKFYRYFSLTTSPEKEAILAERRIFYNIIGEESPPLEHIVTKEVVDVSKEKADTLLKVNVQGHLLYDTTLSKLVEGLYSETRETGIRYGPESLQDNNKHIVMATLAALAIMQLNILPPYYWVNAK